MEQKRVLRNWHFTISLQKKSGLSLHLQIVQALILEVRKGRLLAGAPLPGTRKIAADLGVNRKTAVQAYDELIAQGWIETQARRGAFVSEKLPMPELADANKFSSEHQRAAQPTLKIDQREPEGGTEPGMINFSDGVPDTRLVPFTVLARAFRRALITTARANRLAYDDAQGSYALRSAIAEMLRLERGMAVEPNQVCIVRGSQMGIYLSARLLANCSGSVVMEELSYPPAREAFASFGIAISYVAQDEFGLNVDALEQLCARTNISAVYLTPHHQFPTTSMLSVARRIRLLALAKKFNFLILEDDYDHEFHFSHSPMLPLASMESEGCVIHIGSLSKVLAPGLRLGYMVASKDFIQRCVAQILLIDRQGNALTELAVAEMMRNGELKRHIRRALKIYKIRRDYAVQRVREMLPSVNFSIPAGGLALWLCFDSTIDMEKLERDAQALKLTILPGHLFSGRRKKVSALRLGYANLNESEFDQGLMRLASALQKEET